MKTFFFLLAIVLSNGIMAQNKVPPLDQSSMDISYYPVNYPILKIQDKVSEPLVARVLYSRPQRNNRGVFGELVQYGRVWRMGANEATEIDFFRDVNFAGKLVPKGRYTLYAIPSLQQWTVIVNKETDTWGSFKYDEGKDIARVDVPVKKLSEAEEALTIYFEKASTGFNLSVAWENAGVNIPITVAAGKTPAKAPTKAVGRK